MKKTDILRPGDKLKLIEMPDGRLSPVTILTLGKIYEFKCWDGSNVVITSDDPESEASIWHGRVQFA